MKARVEFTATAERHASAFGILPLAADFTLPGKLVRGDIVEFATPLGTQFFQVESRRLRIGADGRQVLVLRLDHPVR